MDQSFVESGGSTRNADTGDDRQDRNDETYEPWGKRTKTLEHKKREPINGSLVANTIK
jgi:hypothetical protein